MRLVIGNKNYSSWSLRPWLLLQQLGLPFEEEQISFADPQWRRRLQGTPAPGRVPVLLDAEQVIWDSLAIFEYLAERFPDAGIWPRESAARARARCLCAEMHSSFTALRSAWPFNVTARLPGRGWNIAVQQDLERILELWARAQRDFGGEGPFLLGAFSAVDAYYAPVVLRFVTYGVELPEPAHRYCQAVLGLPALRRWIALAAEERDFHPAGEPYRRPPQP